PVPLPQGVALRRARLGRVPLRAALPAPPLPQPQAAPAHAGPHRGDGPAGPPGGPGLARPAGAPVHRLPDPLAGPGPGRRNPPRGAGCGAGAAQGAPPAAIWRAGGRADAGRSGSMSAPSDPRDPRTAADEPAIRFERVDVDPGLVARWAVGLGGVTVVAAAVCIWLLVFLSHREESQDPQRPPLYYSEEQRQPEGGRLQSAP